MSDPSLPVELSPRAQADYTGILQYTLQTWGEEQQDRYDAGLQRALSEIGRYPRIGWRRDALRPGLRSYRADRHVIYYRLDAGVITVKRILHEKMDPVGKPGL